MELIQNADYARAVRPALSPMAFVPAWSRVLWLPVHGGLIATATWALATDRIPGALWIVASMVIGCSFAGITFLAHETLHGGVLRGRRAIRAVGWLGLLPFVLSPTLWTAWHNRVHHNHCGQPGKDPDLFPTLTEHRTQRGARIMVDWFALGRRRWLGALGLLFGLTGQSQQILWKARTLGILSPALHRRAIAETLLAGAVWATIARLTGFAPFVFAYVIPLLVANAIVMTFIMTNHSLSPLTPVNDTLVNSLSVTVPRPLDWLTLGFGYHVEHHVFPTMSMRHGAAIREVLRTKFPDRYQSLPLSVAMTRLFETPRVYRDDTTLIDPATGQTWPTLMPREGR